MIVANLTASRFLGGPERQMLELARHLPAEAYQVLMLSFSEGGLCGEFVHAARQAGFAATALEHDTPHLWSAVDELTQLLDRHRVDLLCCHGYKANLLERLAMPTHRTTCGRSSAWCPREPRIGPERAAAVHAEKCPLSKTVCFPIEPPKITPSRDTPVLSEWIVP
jgi:hypothetical protein